MEGLPAVYTAMDVYRHLVSTGIAADVTLPRFCRLNKRLNRRLQIGHAAGWKCSDCVAGCNVRQGTVDHHVPRSKNGSNRRENLRWMCMACNRRKADKMPKQGVVSTCFRTPTPVVTLQWKRVVRPYGDLFDWA